MGSMGSVAHRAQTIECRNAEGGGEITVRPAADRSLVKLEAKFGCGLGRHPVEADGGGRTLEGRTLHASKNFEAAPWIARAQPMNSSICARGLGCGEESDIDDNFGKISDHVGANASGDESGVEGESLRRTGEPADGDDLVGSLDDGRGAALEVESGVGGTAMDAHSVAGHTLARGFASAGGSGGGLQDEHGAGAEGKALGERARGGTADLLVRDQQEGNRTGQRATDQQGSKSEESLDDSGFHVECAGTREASGALSAGHGDQSSKRVDGVGVAKQKQTRAAARALGRRVRGNRCRSGRRRWREIDLQSRAVVGELVQTDARGERGEIGGDDRDQGGDGIGRGGGDSCST